MRAHFAAVALSLAAACSGTDDAPGDAGAPTADDAASRDDVGPGVAERDAAASDDAADAPDPCESVTPACPQATAKEGAGLVSIDRCAFPIQEADSFATYPALVSALEKITTKAPLSAVLGDLNRSGAPVSPNAVPGGPPGVEIAFGWNAEDAASTTWIPQGITGSADASDSGLVGGRRVVVVSWYHADKGVRLAFVDVTTNSAPKYRFALLVEPKGTASAPDFTPIRIHAGGIAWVGDLLYVADTSRGLRVFDLSRMLQVPTDVDEIGCAGGTCRAGLYKYVVPQVGAFTTTSPCKPLFSFVALDRSTSPPSLVSGEYCSNTACAGPLAGRVLRWPLETGARLRAGRSWPSEAWMMGQRQVQGAASRAGVFYLSSSAPAAGAGELYRVKDGKSATSIWIDTPEDLMVDEQNALLWSLSEAPNERAVMGAALASYPSP